LQMTLLYYEWQSSNLSNQDITSKFD